MSRKQTSTKDRSAITKSGKIPRPVWVDQPRSEQPSPSSVTQKNLRYFDDEGESSSVPIITEGEDTSAERDDDAFTGEAKG